MFCLVFSLADSASDRRDEFIELLKKQLDEANRMNQDLMQLLKKDFK